MQEDLPYAGNRSGGCYFKKMSNQQECRKFVICQYVPDSYGNMLPDVPSKCPHHFFDNSPCKIYKDHERERKTGPFMRSGSPGVQSTA